MHKTQRTRVNAAVALWLAASSALAQAPAAQQAVDEKAAQIENAVTEAGLAPITQIDHARLAAAEGVEMPASRVQIFSDPSVNTPILRENIRAGLDLPFRVLSYADGDTARVAYTGSDFLKARHGLADSSGLEMLDSQLEEVVAAVEGAVAAPTETLVLDYGIIELDTPLSVSDAVAGLKETIMAQGDTVWFGEIDFSAEASGQGVVLPDAVLLLFGGPRPGGIAMADFPAIGLDAFCQKLLVYAGPDGGSVVIFNDIAALAELHYGTSAKPHHALNERLTATFRSAIE